MIVSWSMLVLLPLAAGLAVIFLLWGYYGVRFPGGRLGAAGREEIYRCAVCGRVYVAPGKSKIAHCPRCGSLNEPVKR